MDAVKTTLKSWNLSQYADAFFEQGYDDLAYLKTLSEDMLQRVAAAVGMKPGHAGKFSMYIWRRLLPVYRCQARLPRRCRRLSPSRHQPAPQ